MLFSLVAGPKGIHLNCMHTISTTMIYYFTLFARIDLCFFLSLPIETTFPNEICYTTRLIHSMAHMWIANNIVWMHKCTTGWMGEWKSIPEMCSIVQFHFDLLEIHIRANDFSFVHHGRDVEKERGRKGERAKHLLLTYSHSYSFAIFNRQSSHIRARNNITVRLWLSHRVECIRHKSY